VAKNNGEKPATTPERNVRIMKEKHYLEVQLTEDELKQDGKELADSFKRKNAIEAEMETFKAQKKAEVTQCEGDIAKNAALVSAGKEMRMVDCEVTLDFNAGKRTVARIDNGIIVNERKLNDDEKQLELNV